MTLEEYFGDWMEVIDKKELGTVLTEVGKLYQRTSVCPAQSDVFRAFELCPYRMLKVVFVGQDPYPQKGVATGILFGNRKEVPENNLSPSLKVIKEACINFEIPHNSIIFDQTLESWAKQGILMINSALTVETGKIGSHTMIWREFIGKLLENISINNPGIIYVLFGQQAQTFRPYIQERNPDYIIKMSHPAFYARTEFKMPSELFNLVKDLVKEKYGESIEWFQEC